MSLDLETLISGLKHETITHGQARDMAMTLRPAIAVAEMVAASRNINVHRGDYDHETDHNFNDTVVLQLSLPMEDTDLLLFFLGGGDP